MARENIRFFRSQLTESELVFIGMNILFHEEGKDLLAFIKQFGLLKHLYEAQNLRIIIKHEPDCGDECFKEIE